jgi:FkbM family methyltransferase
VYAFEPQRFVHDLLCASVALNALSWVTVEHAAVGSDLGSVLVPDIDYGVAGNFGGLRLGSWAQGEAVRVITVDSLQPGACSLLKVDVEGMELAVLSGARDTLRRHHPVVYVENNSAQGAAPVVELLQAHGYALFWHFSAFFRPNNFAGHPHDLFNGLVDANMVGVPAASASVLRSLQPVESPVDTAQAALSRRPEVLARRAP